MNVVRTEVVALMVALGQKTAAKWSSARLLGKIKKLPELVADDKPNLEDKKLAKLLKSVLKAVSKDEDIVIETAAKADKAPVKEKADKADKAPAKKAKKEKKKEGPVAIITKMITATSKEKPTTVDAILKKLIQAFPDREEKGMRTTVHCSRNWGPKSKGMLVGRDGNKIWNDGPCEKGTQAPPLRSKKDKDATSVEKKDKKKGKKKDKKKDK